VNSAGDGSVESKLGLHLVNTNDVVVVTDVVDRVLNGPASSILTFSRRRPGAITANVNWAAESVLEVVGGILHARRVVETVLMSILVYLGCAAAIASATSLAVNNRLWVNANRGSGLEVVQDVEAVSNG
jgi:hypothetical protein